MVDFPEGYGFAPTTKANLMNPRFRVQLGVFVSPKLGSWMVSSRRSPFLFHAVAVVERVDVDKPIRGHLLGAVDTPMIEGSLQHVCTALCTLHRLTGGRT
jgi:hypothetical protein